MSAEERPRAINQKKQRGFERFTVTVRPETKKCLVELSENYHLPCNSIVTIAIVELHKMRLGERKKRGNGHP